MRVGAFGIHSVNTDLCVQMITPPPFFPDLAKLYEAKQHDAGVFDIQDEENGCMFVAKP